MHDRQKDRTFKIKIDRHTHKERNEEREKETTERKTY